MNNPRLDPYPMIVRALEVGSGDLRPQNPLTMFHKLENEFLPQERKKNSSASILQGGVLVRTDLTT